MGRGRVLVTGAAGFIGSHLAEASLAGGYTVRAFAHYNSMGTAGWLEGSSIRDQVEIVWGDVRDLDSVQAAVQGCQQVFHLAALIAIPYSYSSPTAYLRTNIEGTHNVLQASLAAGVERVALTSTSETYGTAQYTPIDEKHPAVAQSPYAATKVAADQLGLAFHRSFGLPVTIVRPFNTFGPRQSARAIIPTIISQISSGRRELRLGSLDPTRDLTFVRDTVAGFLAIAECSACTGTATNVGTDDEISVGDLVARIARMMDVQVSIAPDPERVRPPKSEVERLRCDNRRIRELTGWQPRYTLDEGLRETIAWCRDNVALYRPDRYAT